MAATNSIENRLDTIKSPHFLEDCPSWDFQIGKQTFTLQGHSIAGERTGFHIPQLRIFLDGGMNSYQTCKSIFITHSHSDHSHNLPCVAMGQNGMITQRPQVFIPEEAAKPLQMLARASQALNDCRELADRDEMNIRGVQAGSEFEILAGKKSNIRLKVDVLPCFHTVPSVGYTFSLVTTRLRPELQGISGAELKHRREVLKEEIREDYAQPMLTFLGDTTVEVFDLAKNPAIFKSPIVIVECTGVDPVKQAPDEIAKRGHVHWSQLEPIVKSHPSIKFIIIHFSNSLSEAQILTIIQQSQIKNIILWFDSGIVDLSLI